MPAEVFQMVGLLFGWVIAGFAFAFVMMQIVNAWLVDKVLSFFHAVLLIVVAFLLLGAVWVTRGHGGMAVYVVLMLGVAGAVHLLNEERERRLLKDLRNESMAQYRAVIARDPKNAAAHSFLAEKLLEIGELDEAIVELEKCVELDPERSYRERWRLKQLQEEQRRRAGNAPILCPECRAENAPGSRACAACQASLNTSFFAWLFTPRNLRDVLFRSAIPLLAAIVLIAVFFVLPLPLQGVVLAAAVFVGIFLLIRRIGGGGA